MKRILVLTGLLLCLLGCRSRSVSTPQETTDWVARELTGGTGLSAAPNYVVTVFADGRVTFKGVSLVKRQETLTKKIKKKKVDPLFAKLATLKLDEIETLYSTHTLENGTKVQRPAETPYVVLTISVGGKTKRINDLFFAPTELKEIAEWVRETADVEKWVGKPKDRKP